MGIPIVVGDIGGPYQPPGVGPPVMATMVTGSTRVFIRGRPVLLFPSPAVTSLGTIVSSTLNTSIVRIEGRPVLLGGSVTNLSSGFSAGTLIASTAAGVNLN